jgi:hypothetical protein
LIGVLLRHNLRHIVIDQAASSSIVQDDGLGMAGVPHPGAKTRPTPASQYPSEQIVEISKVWAYTNCRLALEFRRTYIKAELREFVEGDE